MYFESDLSCFSSPIWRMCFPDLACSLSLIWRHLASVAGVSLTLSFSVFAHVLASFGITYFWAPSVGACARFSLSRFLFVHFVICFFRRSDVWHLERSSGFGGSITTQFGT